MADTLKTVLLLALPASGKSEVRRYLAHLSPQDCARAFHLGETVQLDDFPYVHLMRRIDEELEKNGQERLFYYSGEDTFTDKRDWGTLIKLINQDYAALTAHAPHPLNNAAKDFFARLESCGAAVGIPSRLGQVDAAIQERVAAALEPEVQDLYQDLNAAMPEDLSDKTVVIEFARGGPDGSEMPLPPPHGYQYSLAQLSPEVLDQASILYIWVTPEESRRKNNARSDPDDPGSILHHGVPMSVMLGEYGCDDLDWLEAQSSKPGTVEITGADGTLYRLPLGRFDNRVDKTTFIREAPELWRPDAVQAIHTGLREALSKLNDYWKS
jgi:hypothetical protein